MVCSVSRSLGIFKVLQAGTVDEFLPFLILNISTILPVGPWFS